MLQSDSVDVPVQFNRSHTTDHPANPKQETTPCHATLPDESPSREQLFDHFGGIHARELAVEPLEFVAESIEVKAEEM